MTVKFSPKSYQGKDRIFRAVPGAPRISRMYVWDHAKGEYLSPPRGKLYWTARYEPNGNGGYKRSFKLFATLTEARQWQANSGFDPRTILSANSTLSNGQRRQRSLQFGDGYTILDLIQDWQHFGWTSIREGTKIYYSKALPFMEPLYGLEVEKLHPRMIDAWISELRTKALQGKFTKRRMSFEKEFEIFKTMLRWYMDSNDDTRLPWPLKKRHTKMLIMKEGMAGRAKFMQPSEYRMWLEILKREEPAFFPLAYIQLRQMLRVSEVCAMKWSHLNLREKTYRLSEYVFWPRVNGKPPEIRQGSKNMRAGEFHDLPLRDDVVELIKVMKRDPDVDLIFHDMGKILTYRQVQHAFNLAFKKAGLPYRSTHICRHTGATEFLNETGDYLALKQMGNWSDLKTALHYGEIARTRAREAVDKADKKLRLVHSNDSNFEGEKVV